MGMSLHVTPTTQFLTNGLFLPQVETCNAEQADAFVLTQPVAFFTCGGGGPQEVGDEDRELQRIRVPLPELYRAIGC